MKKYSKDGYKRNSKDRKNPYNIIPSGRITMKDVDFPVHGTDNLGNSQIMMPGGEYVFPGNEVFEVPLAQNGIELETQPVEINTEGLRRPLHVPGQPIVSDNLSENPMDQTPRNYINDRVEYWEDPNSLAKSRMDGDHLDDNFIEPMGQTSDRLVEYFKNRSTTDYENDRKIFLKNLDNVAFLDMSDSQKYAQGLLEEFAANDENPFDMIDDPEEYGYKDLIEMFKDRPDIRNIARMVMEDSEGSNYETSSSAVAFTADDEFLERHKDDIDFYNLLNSEAIKEGKKEKRELSYERGDLLDREYIDTLLEDHGEDPNDPKWDKVRSFIIMNPDMHKIVPEMDEGDYNTTLAHEIGHIERAEYLSDRDISLLQTFNNSYDNLPEDKRTDHHTNTGEAYADITAIRQDMLDKGIYDWRYEQMTLDHWQQYLSEYEEDNYPLVLQRTIDRYRVLPGESEWDTHNEEQLKTKDQDTNIIYLNNNIADAEIGDDVDMGYAQEGGEQNWLQKGAQGYTNLIKNYSPPGMLYKAGKSFVDYAKNTTAEEKMQHLNNASDTIYSMTTPGMIQEGYGYAKDLYDGKSFYDVKEEALDNTQKKLQVVGNWPGYGDIGDAVNAGIDVVRGATTDDAAKRDKHYKNAAVNVESIYNPAAGAAATLDTFTEGSSDFTGSASLASNIIDEVRPDENLAEAIPAGGGGGSEIPLEQREEYDKEGISTFMQSGGELKKFEPGGSTHGNITINTDNDQPIFSATSGYQNEVKKPELPEPNIEDLFIVEGTQDAYFQELNTLEEEMQYLKHLLQQELINKQIRKSEPKKYVDDDAYNKVDPSGGLGHSIPNLPNLDLPEPKSHKELQIESEIAKLAERGQNLHSQYIKEEYLLNPQDPNSFYHDYYLQEQKYIAAEQRAYSNYMWHEYGIETNPNETSFRAPSRYSEQQRNIPKVDNSFSIYNAPNWQFMIGASPGLRAMQQQAQITGDWSAFNQVAADFSPVNPENLLMGAFSTPLPILNYGVRIGKFGRIPGITDDLIAPIFKKGYQGAKTYVPGVKHLDDLISAANSNKNIIHTPETMFYRNGNVVGLRPNLKRPPAFSKEQWRHLQTLEWDISNLHKVYPKLDFTKVISQQVKNQINPALSSTTSSVTTVPSSLATTTVNPVQQAVNTSIALPIAAQTIGNRSINYTGQNDVVSADYQTQLFNNIDNNTLQLNTLREGSQTFNKLFNNTDKNGYVSRQLLEKVINGASKNDRLYLERVLNSPIYSGQNKIPLLDFKRDVSNSIIPLNKVVSATHDKDWNRIVDANGTRQEGYGYDRIGYNIDLDNIRGYTVSLQNPQKLGLGDTHLGTDMNKYNLGWFRGMTTKENPHIFTKVENQSNWYAHGNNKKNPNKYGEIKDMTTFSQPPSDWTGTRLEWIQLQKNNELNKLNSELLDASNNLDNLNKQWDIYKQQGSFDTRNVGIMDNLGRPNPYYDKVFTNEMHSELEINNIYNDALKNNTEKINIINSKINALENVDSAGQLALATNNGIYNRTLAESIVWAAQEGFTTYRIPTVRTSARLQGHDRDIIQVQNWDEFVVNIDQSKDFLSNEITQGTNLLKLHEPLVDEAILTGGLRVRRSIKDGFLNKDGFIKPRFQRKYEKELEKLQKESRDAKENMKRRRSQYSVKVSKEVEKELMDLHYEMYLADESLYTGSHDRWIHKEPGIRQIDPETMELGEIPYTEVPQRAAKDGMHNQPWREELYQKQLELGRQLTKEELINFGIMGDSNYGMISTQGGRWGFTHGGRGSGTSRDESIEYQPFTDDEYKRLKDVQNKIFELDDKPKNALQEWSRVERLKLKELQKQMDNDFINIWYNETELLIPNSPGVTDHYFTYSPTNNNLAEQDQLVSYFDTYKDYSKVDLDAPSTYNFGDDKNYEVMYKQLQKEPQLIKKWFGDDVEIVLVQDAYGNQYYEFVIPQSVYDGTWEVPSRKHGGQVYQNGGSYIKGSSEDPNIYPDQEFTWYNPMDWYRDWSSISPEEVIANARNEGYESWYSVLPKHLQNTNYYDLEGAYEAGLDPVWSEDHNEYHLGSRDPRTGKLFKYEDHPTFNKLIQGETDEGNVIWYDSSGDMYSGKEVPEGMYEFEEYSDQYLAEYLQFVENSLKTGFDPVTGLWQPYRGVDSKGKKEKFHTIGYGHQLSKEEYKLYKKGISQEKVDELLQKDIAEAQRKLDIRYGKDQWYRDLHPREKAILLDIEYNVRGGMNAFPNLLEAIQTGNKTLLLTEFWRDLPEGKDNVRNQEFKRKFIIPVSNMYKYNKRQAGGEIKQMQEERPVWDKRRSRLKQQLKVYQQGGEISPFAEEELINLGLINPQDDLSMPIDNTAVATNEINFSLLDPEMNLTPKSDNEEEFGEMNLTGSIRSNQNDDDEEDDIEDEEDETNDDEDAGDDNEDLDNEEDDNEEDEDEDSEEDDDTEDDEDDEDDDDDEHFTPEPIEVDSYASGRGSQYERIKPSDDTWTGSPNRVSQPMQIPPTRVKPGQIREYQTPIPRDFTSQMLAAEFARSNYGEQQQPLTFDYLQRTYGDFNPGRQQMQQAQEGGEQLPNVIINEGSPQLYDHMDNTIYVHPEDVEGPEVPYISEHEPDHVLRHELEHYYQWQDLKDEEWPNMAPIADGEYDIITDTSWHPRRQDNPMSQRLEDDREMIMRDMYLQVLDPDGTNFWLQNMDIEDLMDELALDNEAIYQLERQVMNQPIHVRDYMLERIRGERAERLYLQATEEVYYDPRTLEGQARMIEDDGRQDAHVIETLKHQAIKNKEEGISDHPYIKKEMKTLQKNQKGGESKKKSKYATEVDEFNKLNQGYLLGETAYNMFINEEDTSRPPAGKKEKIISSILPFKNCWYNNACVQTVKDIFNNAGIDSGIPDDVYDNLTFLKNYKDYGFELIDNASEEDMRMGDIIQFNYTEEEYPYHMGMYIADDQYISDGEHDKPIQKKSVSGKGAYKIFRKV